MLCFETIFYFYFSFLATNSSINILAGILQGDNLAPFHFILVLDYVLRKFIDLNYSNGLQLHPRKSSRVPAVHLTYADFADDFCTY